jgi:hypothetical protein
MKSSKRECNKVLINRIPFQVGALINAPHQQGSRNEDWRRLPVPPS